MPSVSGSAASLPSTANVFQVEDHDRAFSSAVGNETASKRGNNCHAMRDLLSGNVAEYSAGAGVEHEGMRGARNEQTMRIWIDGEVIPSAFSANVHRSRNFPLRLRECRKG